MQVYRSSTKKVASLVMSIALVGILGSVECLGQQMLASKYSGALCV